jgi:hypothetical protein
MFLSIISSIKYNILEIINILKNEVINMKKKQKIIKVKKQNNIKKTIIKSSIGLVFLGGISTAIGIPLANNIKNKTNVIKKVDLEEVAYTDADGKK